MATASRRGDRSLCRGRACHRRPQLHPPAPQRTERRRLLANVDRPRPGSRREGRHPVRYPFLDEGGVDRQVAAVAPLKARGLQTLCAAPTGYRASPSGEAGKIRQVALAISSTMVGAQIATSSRQDWHRSRRGLVHDRQGSWLSGLFVALRKDGGRSSPPLGQRPGARRTSMRQRDFARARGGETRHAYAGRGGHLLRAHDLEDRNDLQFASCCELHV